MEPKWEPTNEEADKGMQTLLEEWVVDPQNTKAVFLKLKNKVSQMEGVMPSFISRPGISHSLRAGIKNIGGGKGREYFVLLDIVEDQTEGRWLSLCFYSDSVTDPEDEGNLIPDGLPGDDGYCFDVFEYNENLISYYEQRIDEAYVNAKSFKNTT